MSKEDKDIIKCESKEDKALHKALRKALIKPKDQPSSEFTRKFRVSLATQDRTVVVEDAYEACDRLDTSEQQWKDLLEVLRSYIDDDSCSYDHHGCCQTYGGDPCRNQQAKAAIAKAEKEG